VSALRDALPTGSFLAISHASYEGLPRETYAQIERLYASTPTPLKARSCAEIERFFDGFALVEPGVVHIPLWRPEGADDLMLDHPERNSGFAGVGRKP
jgi:hypothetical protein